MLNPTSNNFLSNCVALVTASSRGMGRTIALSLGQYGARVMVNYTQHQSAAEDVAREINQLGGEACAIQADVSQPEQARRLVHESHDYFGQIDVLINNAGPFRMQSLAETTIDDWHTMLDGNLNSAFYCTHYALPFMKKQKSGHVLFIGCVKADTMRARHNACAYGIAKTGVLLLAKTLAREEGPNGIRANVINPGIIDNGSLNDEERDNLRRQIAQRRIGRPEDVADAALFLLSPQAAYCNGAVLNVDGGLWL